jgi:hypothetical protein
MVRNDLTEHQSSSMNDIDRAMVAKLGKLAPGIGRLLETLDMADTTAERQRRLTEKRRAEGKQKYTVWAAPEIVESLKAAFPGQRNGIDWQAVLTAALHHRKESNGTDKSKSGT